MAEFRILLVRGDRQRGGVDEQLRACGYTVECASSGEAAMVLIQCGVVHMLVVDEALPGLDGLSLCRWIRQGAQPQLPVILLCATEAVEERLAAFEAGADDCLLAPFAFAELEARVNALARRAAPRETQTIRVADLVYDRDTRLAQRAGQSLQLNPTTRALLELLMEQSPRTVPRKELEQAIWAQFPRESVLRVHMYALRRAIDGRHARKLLHTAYGVGYRVADCD